MQARGIALLAMLSVSLLSYGLPMDALAQSAVPVQVSTDSEIYSDGSTVKITITLNKADDSFPNSDITLTVRDPTNNYVRVEQIKVSSPDPVGEYSVDVKAAPNWNTGAYSIMAKYGANSGDAMFEFNSSGAPAPPPPVDDDPEQPIEPTPPPEEEVPPGPSCPSSQELVGDRCLDKCSSEQKRADDGMCVSLCSDGMKMVGGECVSDCADGEVLKDGQCTSICAEGTVFIDGVCTNLCGPGTVWQDGTCIADKPTSGGGACLIATAAYGTELAPQVQMLREIRDGKLLSTGAGSSFIAGFNTAYYAFSPAVADLERASPEFRGAVQVMVAPMLSTLSIMQFAEEGSESSVLGLGLSVIALNIGMYIAAPAAAAVAVRRLLARR